MKLKSQRKSLVPFFSISKLNILSLVFFKSPFTFKFNEYMSNNSVFVLLQNFEFALKNVLFYLRKKKNICLFYPNLFSNPLYNFSSNLNTSSTLHLVKKSSFFLLNSTLVFHLIRLDRFMIRDFFDFNEKYYFRIVFVPKLCIEKFDLRMIRDSSKQNQLNGCRTKFFEPR